MIVERCRPAHEYTLEQFYETVTPVAQNTPTYSPGARADNSMVNALAKKVLLIGWDAADWKLINPLLDQGLMPTLDDFVDHGVMGNLATLRPQSNWRAIATARINRGASVNARLRSFLHLRA